jgi:hypothetical protein
MKTVFADKATALDLEKLKVRQTLITDKERRNLLTALRWGEAWAANKMDFLFDEIYADAAELVDAGSGLKVSGPKGQKDAVKKFEKDGSANAPDRTLTFTSACASEDTVILEAAIEIVVPNGKNRRWLLCTFLTFDPKSGRIVVDHTYNLLPEPRVLARMQAAARDAAKLGD